MKKIKFVALIMLLTLPGVQVLVGCKGSSTATATAINTSTPITTSVPPGTTTATSLAPATTTVPPTTTKANTTTAVLPPVTTTAPPATTTPPVVESYRVYCSDSTGFSPKILKDVPVGAKVIWESPDDFDFQIVLDTGLIIGSVPPRGTLEFIFVKAGTYNYHDGMNPTLTGTIVVVE